MVNNEFGFIDESIFGNEAGEEEEPEILNSYFVKMDNFKRLDSFENRFVIIKAMKGLGKSSLLSKLNYDKNKEEPDSIILFIKGSDLITFFEPTDFSNPNHLINGWQKCLCKHLNCKIGEKIKIALDDTSISLVETSELAGVRGRNIVSALVDRIKINLPITKKENNKEINNQKALLSRFNENNDFKAWILIDDIDATFINNQDSCLQLSTFLSCCRKMVSDFRGLSIRVSLRSDVWSIINRIDEALDKSEQYISEIRWDEEAFNEMLALKIHSYITRNNCYGMYGFSNHEIDPIKNPNLVVRELFAHRFDWFGEHFSASEFIFLMADRRPRWAINLCKKALQSAIKSNRNVITTEDFNKALEFFGKDRLDDIYKEYRQEFPKIKEVIILFINGPALHRTQDLLYIIEKKIIQIKPEIYINGVLGKVDCLQVAHFLFKIGFIHANRHGVYKLKNIYKYEDKFELLKDKYNMDQGFCWMINPIYQRWLNIKILWSEKKAPKEWVDSFFHPPFRKQFSILKDYPEQITILDKIFKIRVREIAHVKGSKKNLIGAKVVISERGWETKSENHHVMVEGKIITKKINGIIYYFKLLKIITNPKKIDIEIDNRIKFDSDNSLSKPYVGVGVEPN